MADDPKLPKPFIKEKIEKIEHKEKPEKSEHKEKPEKSEHKEKPEKSEHKEKPEKSEHKEKPEKWEHKEKPEKGEKREFLEKLHDAEKQLEQIDAPGSPIEQRVAALEKAVAEVHHFITTGERPDTSRGALAAEPDQKPKKP